MQKFQVSFIGLNNLFGKTSSLLLKQSPYVKCVKLYDVSNIGPALDVSQINTQCKVNAFLGKEQLGKSVKGSDIVVIGDEFSYTNGDDNQLFTAASKFFDYAKAIATYAPQAVIVVASSPVNVLLPVLTEILLREGGYNQNKVIGATSVDTIRANSVLATHLGMDPKHVLLPVIGGSSENTRVPIFSQSKPLINLKLDEKKQLIVCIREGEKRVAEMKGVRESLNRAYATMKLLNSVMAGLRGEPNVNEITLCKTDKMTGVDYASLPVTFGRSGITKCYGIPKLHPCEVDMLESAVGFLKKDIDKARFIIKGTDVLEEHKHSVSMCNDKATQQKEIFELYVKSLHPEIDGKELKRNNFKDSNPDQHTLIKRKRRVDVGNVPNELSLISHYDPTIVMCEPLACPLSKKDFSPPALSEPKLCSEPAKSKALKAVKTQQVEHSKPSTASASLGDSKSKRGTESSASQLRSNVMEFVEKSSQKVESKLVVGKTSVKKEPSNVPVLDSDELGCYVYNRGFSTSARANMVLLDDILSVPKEKKLEPTRVFSEVAKPEVDAAKTASTREKKYSRQEPFPEVKQSSQMNQKKVIQPTKTHSESKSETKKSREMVKDKLVYPTHKVGPKPIRVLHRTVAKSESKQRERDVSEEGPAASGGLVEHRINLATHPEKRVHLSERLRVIRTKVKSNPIPRENEAEQDQSRFEGQMDIFKNRVKKVIVKYKEETRAEPKKSEAEPKTDVKYKEEFGNKEKSAKQPIESRIPEKVDLVLNVGATSSQSSREVVKECLQSATRMHTSAIEKDYRQNKRIQKLKEYAEEMSVEKKRSSAKESKVSSVAEKTTQSRSNPKDYAKYIVVEKKRMPPKEGVERKVKITAIDKDPKRPTYKVHVRETPSETFVTKDNDKTSKPQATKENTENPSVEIESKLTHRLVEALEEEYNRLQAKEDAESRAQNAIERESKQPSRVQASEINKKVSKPLSKDSSDSVSVEKELKANRPAPDDTRHQSKEVVEENRVQNSVDREAEINKAIALKETKSHSSAVERDYRQNQPQRDTIESAQNKNRVESSGDAIDSAIFEAKIHSLEEDTSRTQVKEKVESRVQRASKESDSKLNRLIAARESKKKEEAEKAVEVRKEPKKKSKKAVEKDYRKSRKIRLMEERLNLNLPTLESASVRNYNHLPEAMDQSVHEILAGINSTLDFKRINASLLEDEAALMSQTNRVTPKPKLVRPWKKKNLTKSYVKALTNVKKPPIKREVENKAQERFELKVAPVMEKKKAKFTPSVLTRLAVSATKRRLRTKKNKMTRAEVPSFDEFELRTANVNSQGHTPKFSQDKLLRRFKRIELPTERNAMAHSEIQNKKSASKWVSSGKAKEKKSRNHLPELPNDLIRLKSLDMSNLEYKEDVWRWVTEMNGDVSQKQQPTPVQKPYNSTYWLKPEYAPKRSASVKAVQTFNPRLANALSVHKFKKMTKSMTKPTLGPIKPPTILAQKPKPKPKLRTIPKVVPPLDSIHYFSDLEDTPPLHHIHNLGKCGKTTTWNRLTVERTPNKALGQEPTRKPIMPTLRTKRLPKCLFQRMKPQKKVPFLASVSRTVKPAIDTVKTNMTERSVPKTGTCAEFVKSRTSNLNPDPDVDLIPPFKINDPFLSEPLPSMPNEYHSFFIPNLRMTKETFHLMDSNNCLE